MYEPDDYTTARASFVVAASHSTPNAPPVPLFRLCSVAGRVNSNAAGKTDNIKCQIHMYKQRDTAMLHTHYIWHRCVYVRRGQCLLASLCLLQGEIAALVCPPSACQRSEGLKEHLELMEKQTSLLSLIAPWCLGDN